MFHYNPDNKILQALDQYADLLLLSALWLLTSLPLVTVGASTTALYGVLLKLASGRDETSVARAFFQRWRSEWKQGTRIWLCLLAFFALVGADLWVCLRGRPEGAAGRVLWMGSILALLSALVLSVYVFAVNAQFKCTLGQTFANALRLAVGSPLWTLLLILLMALSAASIVALGFFSIAVLGVLLYQSARVLHRLFVPALRQYAQEPLQADAGEIVP